METGVRLIFGFQTSKSLILDEPILGGTVSMHFGSGTEGRGAGLGRLSQRTACIIALRFRSMEVLKPVIRRNRFFTLMRRAAD
jgi:hypothetical protein